MTAIATERTTIAKPLWPDRDALDARAIAAPTLARTPSNAGLPELADATLPPRRAPRRANPVFHWG